MCRCCGRSRGRSRTWAANRSRLSRRHHLRSPWIGISDNERGRRGEMTRRNGNHRPELQRLHQNPSLLFGVIQDAYILQSVRFPLFSRSACSAAIQTPCRRRTWPRIDAHMIYMLLRVSSPWFVISPVVTRLSFPAISDNLPIPAESPYRTWALPGIYRTAPPSALSIRFAG